MKYNIGQKVWIYDSPLKPLKAVITSVDPIIGYHVEFESSMWEFMTKKGWCEHQVFARPKDRTELISRVESDIETLQWAVDALRLE